MAIKSRTPTDKQCTGERQFNQLKVDLEHAVKDAENGNFADFDPRAYEPAYTEKTTFWP